MEKHPNTWSICNATDMERIPFFHYYPGERVLQVGGIHCNANCAYCINAHIAISPEKENRAFVLTPEEIVHRAKANHLHLIHFGVNEVTVNLPSAIEVAKRARENDIEVGVSTNGFMTPETTALMLQHFSFFNISLKSIPTDFYQRYLGLPSVDPVLQNIRHIAGRAHLEITTPVVHQGNEEELWTIAEFLGEIDPRIPWHIFRLIPENQMTYDDVPDVGKIAQSIQRVRQKLPFVYFGNFIGSNWLDTVCPQCGDVVVERLCDSACGSRLMANVLQEGSKCPKCGEPISMVM